MGRFDGMTKTAYALATTEPVGLDKLEAFAEGLDHSEGIAIASDGTTYVGGEGGQIYRIVDDEPKEVANIGGFVLGLAADGDDLLYAVNMDLPGIVRVDPANGDVQEFTKGNGDRAMRVPNWLAFDSGGNLYVSDSGDWNEGNGLIWVVRPGRRAEVWTEAPKDFPNGLCVSPDGSTMYLVESTPGRIVRIPINEDGTAGEREVLCELGYVVPDGVALAEDGSLVVACYRPDAILRWSEADGLEVLVSDPQGTAISAPTNVAFPPADPELLVCPNLAGWHMVRGRLGVTGAPLARPSTKAIEGG
jgi:sugar lactone lactonase YvrE